MKRFRIVKMNCTHKVIIYLLLGMTAIMSVIPCRAQDAKCRVIVTTDIGGTDPDDEQSMVHLLMCANDLDIEGLICQMAFCESPIGIETLRKILKAYEQSYPNLVAHDSNFPTYEYLYSITTTGQTKVGMSGVGEGMDTPGSELIIDAVDRDDPRPVWLTAWGGMNTIAQAIWKVQNTRTEAELQEFLSKIRIYDILGQCDAGAWIAHNFPDVLYIRARDVYGWGPDDNWTRTNIQAYMPMGDVYPSRRWATEGDSPSFMYLIDNGLNMPECITAGGWGGRFNAEKTAALRGMDWVERNNLDEPQYDPYYMYTNPEGEATITRWCKHIHNDFAARIQWSCQSNYADANHHPIIMLDDEATPTRLPLYIDGIPGQKVYIDTNNSYDPDGDNISVKAYLYKEASYYKSNLQVKVDNGIVSFTVPSDAVGLNLHIIVEVTDSGTPAITTYRRAIVRVEDPNGINDTEAEIVASTYYDMTGREIICPKTGVYLAKESSGFHKVFLRR